MDVRARAHVPQSVRRRVAALGWRVARIADSRENKRRSEREEEGKADKWIIYSVLEMFPSYRRSVYSSAIRVSLTGRREADASGASLVAERI